MKKISLFSILFTFILFSFSCNDHRYDRIKVLDYKNTNKKKKKKKPNKDNEREKQEPEDPSIRSIKDALDLLEEMVKKTSFSSQMPSLIINDQQGNSLIEENNIVVCLEKIREYFNELIKKGLAQEEAFLFLKEAIEKIKEAIEKFSMTEIKADMMIEPGKYEAQKWAKTHILSKKRPSSLIQVQDRLKKYIFYFSKNKIKITKPSSFGEVINKEVVSLDVAAALAHDLVLAIEQAYEEIKIEDIAQGKLINLEEMDIIKYKIFSNVAAMDIIIVSFYMMRPETSDNFPAQLEIFKDYFTKVLDIVEQFDRYVKFLEESKNLFHLKEIRERKDDLAMGLRVPILLFLAHYPRADSILIRENSYLFLKIAQLIELIEEQLPPAPLDPQREVLEAQLQEALRIEE